MMVLPHRHIPVTRVGAQAADALVLLACSGSSETTRHLQVLV